MNKNKRIEDWLGLFEERVSERGTLSWDSRRILRSKLVAIPFNSIDEMLEYIRRLDKFPLHPAT